MIDAKKQPRYRIGKCLGLWLLFAAGQWNCALSGETQVHNEFDVVIAGGSTAAFAAAISSAKSGAKTALLEPTDWVGGQLTSSGVPAVDEAWHTVAAAEGEGPSLNVALIARDPRNITPNFLGSLQAIDGCGDCWVSRYCFRPVEYLESSLHPMRDQVADNLTIFYETVVKSLECDDNGEAIISLTAIERAAADSLPHRGYDKLPSQDLADWYGEEDSKRFSKTVHQFINKSGSSTVFVDATEWGELLALSGTDYLQGVEQVEGETGGNDTCGQSTVYCFVQRIRSAASAQGRAVPQADRLGYGDYQDKENPWELIWTYRRIKGQGKSAVGDLCLQNWGYSKSREHGGNDYPFGYLFKSKHETQKEVADWQGGINGETLAAAEQRALGWHEWFRKQAPSEFDPDQIVLAGEEMGTGHGLAKLPYIRDTRRSIGLDGFVLKFADLTGPASQVTGKVFKDRIALGAYPADVHPLAGCEYPKYISGAHDTLPFCIPFRALTHHRHQNLLVTGKTMAQSFLANSATRLHPIEWSSGTAAGVIAAHMAETGKDSREVLETIEEVQPLVAAQTPIDWTLPVEDSEHE